MDPDGGAPFDGGESREERVLAARVLALALLLGLVRFFGLAHWSLWLDEAYTLSDSPHAWQLRNPVGYALFDAFYRLFEGRPSELVLRFPGALFGWLALAATGWVLRRWVGALGAALAALFLALSPWHLFWSQNARFYTLAQVLGLVATWLVFLGLVRGKELRLLAGLALAGVATLTHPSAVFLLGALIFVPWIARRARVLPGTGGVLPARRVWWTLGGLAIVAALAGSVWLADVYATWEKRQGRGDPLHFVRTTGYLVTPSLGLAACVGAWQGLRARAGNAGFLALFVLVGFGAALLTSFLVRVSAQYVFVLLPFVAGLAAVPFRAALLAGSRRAVLLLLLVCLPLVTESVLYFAVRHGDRPRWQEAYRYVFDHREPQDLVLGMDAPVAEYYWSPRSGDLRHWREVVLLDSYRSRAAEEWLRYERPMWLVVNHEQLQDWPEPDRGDMQRFLSEACRLEASFPVPLTPRDLDVLVYRYRPGGREAD